MVLIIFQYRSISNQHVVHLKITQCYMSTIFSKLREKLLKMNEIWGYNRIIIDGWCCIIIRQYNWNLLKENLSVLKKTKTKQKKQPRVISEVLNVLINLTRGILSQYIHTWNHVVHFKYIIIVFVNYTTIKLDKIFEDFKNRIINLGVWILFQFQFNQTSCKNESHLWHETTRNLKNDWVFNKIKELYLLWKKSKHFDCLWYSTV